MSGHKRLGAWGESQAAEYLTQKGYCIKEKNLRTPYGEIDLVAEYEGGLVFVEVKTRSSTRFGYPEEAVTPQKLDHLLAAAQCYLQELTDFTGDWRIDAVAIARRPGASPPEIVHFENILTRLD